MIKPIKENIYRKARLRAAAFNEKFKSREGASEAIGIGKDQLCNYEVGQCKQIPVEAVIRMAEVYNSPELMRHYCCNECAIGKLTMKKVELCEIERMTIKVLAVLNVKKIKSLKNSLVNITEDGEITPDEMSCLKALIDNFSEISAKLQTFAVMAKKYMPINERR